MRRSTIINLFLPPLFLLHSLSLFSLFFRFFGYFILFWFGSRSFFYIYPLLHNILFLLDFYNILIKLFNFNIYLVFRPGLGNQHGGGAGSSPFWNTTSSAMPPHHHVSTNRLYTSSCDPKICLLLSLKSKISTCHHPPLKSSHVPPEISPIILS